MSATKHPAAAEKEGPYGLAVRYRAADLHGATPVITLSGWNVPAAAVPSPAP